MEHTKKDRSKTRLSLGQDDNALTWLMILIAIGFIVVNAVKIVLFMGSDGRGATVDVGMENVGFHTSVLPLFALSTDLSMLAHHPWTLLTYMFTHESVWHVISTLLWLWAFGYILQDLSGNRHLFPLFIYGGLVGGVIFLISSNAIHNFANGPLALMMGAGASVMAVAVATTALAPNFRIFPMINGGIPLWVIMLVYVAVDYATIATANGGTALAHLSGGIFGFFYMVQLKKGNDWSSGMVRFFNWAKDLANPEKKYKNEDPKTDLFYKKEKEPFKIYPRPSQDRLDEILDKINRTGYESLTEEEKIFLKKMSEG
ncbi:MAG: rhomboid family intramembrane serine protease [Chitinophagaceae bacterium]